MTEIDDRYATYREHAELRERVVAVEATMPQMAQTLSRIEIMVARQPPPAPATPPVDHVALAMQRALDAFERRSSDPGGMSVIVRALAIVGAVAIGATGMWFFIHH